MIQKWWHMCCLRPYLTVHMVKQATHVQHTSNSQSSFLQLLGVCLWACSDLYGQKWQVLYMPKGFEMYS